MRDVNLAKNEAYHAVCTTDRRKRGRGWRRGAVAVTVLAMLVSACATTSEESGEQASPAPGDASPEAAADPGSEPEPDLEEGCETVQQISFAGGGGHVSRLNAPFFSVPQYMGYWVQECLSVRADVTRSTLGLMQLLATGQLDVALGGPAGMLQARDEGVDAMTAFQGVYRNFFWMAVRPDSPIESIADLEGGTLGLNSEGDQVVSLWQAEFAEAGLDPNDVEMVAVGSSTPAMDELDAGNIDAVGYWLDRYTELEDQDYEFRYLHSPVENLFDFSSSMHVLRSNLEEKPEAFVGLFRGMCKGLIVAHENPEATIRMHWNVYPESKPTDRNEEEALDDAVRALNAKMEHLWPVAGQEAGLKCGEMDPEVVETFVSFLAESNVTEETDSSSVFTNDLIDRINDFDLDAVRAAASEVTVP